MSCLWLCELGISDVPARRTWHGTRFENIDAHTLGTVEMALAPWMPCVNCSVQSHAFTGWKAFHVEGLPLWSWDLSEVCRCFMGNMQIVGADTSPCAYGRT